ncbi:CHASE2 domain-containing protein [Methylobacterium sp. JK268]
MSDHQAAHTRDRHGVFFRASANTLAGFFFASLLSTSIIILSSIPPIAGPFLAIKRLGVDLGMEIHAEIYARVRRELSQSKLEPRLVFLDITQVACETSLKPAIERCRAGHPAQPELVYDVLAATLGGAKRPAVVIVDAALVDRKAAPDWPPPGQPPLRSAGTPVIYAVTGRVTDEPGTIWLDARDDPVAAGVLDKDGAFDALAQTFIDTDDTDDMLRRYAPALLTRPAAGGQRELKPTVAMAAAVAVAEGPKALSKLVADLKSGATGRCDTARAAGHGAPEHGAQAGGHGFGYGFDPDLICLSALTPSTADRSRVRVPELLFTLRSLAYPRGRAPAPTAITASAEDNLERAASLRVPVTDVAQFRQRPASLIRLFDGAVVVIGTSAASARDVHATPIGTMAGAEVVLNAVRAFLSFPVTRHPTLLVELRHELELVSGASIMFLVIWCAIELLASKIAGASLPTGIVLRAAIGATFVSGIAVIILALLYWDVRRNVPDVGHGMPPPDILTPIFALSLEGFAKASKWMLVVFHTMADRCLERALSWIGPSVSILRPRVSRPVGGPAASPTASSGVEERGE